MEMDALVAKLRLELAGLNLKVRMGQLSQNTHVREVRRTIARVLTIMGARVAPSTGRARGASPSRPVGAVISSEEKRGPGR